MCNKITEPVMVYGMKAMAKLDEVGRWHEIARAKNMPMDLQIQKSECAAQDITADMDNSKKRANCRDYENTWHMILMPKWVIPISRQAAVAAEPSMASDIIANVGG